MGKPSAETLAYHFDRAGLSDKALGYIEQAGDDAHTQYAHAAAERSYRDVLARLQGSGHERDRARVQEKLGTVLMSTGRYHEALQTVLEAEAIHATTNDLDAVGRTAAQAGQAFFLLGSSREGILHLKSVTEMLETHGGAGSLAALYASLADLYFACGRFEDELEAAQRASGLAWTAGDRRTYATAEVSRGIALISIGRREEALSVLEEVVPLARSLGDLASLSRALDNIANVYWSRGEFHRHREYLEQAVEVAERIADPAASLGLIFMLGANALMVGDWHQADSLFDRADTVSRQIEKSRISMFGLFGKGALSVATGEWEMADTYLGECIETAERTGNLQMLSVAWHHWAERMVLSGRADEVIQSVRPLVARSEIGDRGLSHLYVGLARSYLQRGDLPAADQASTSAVRHAEVANDYLARVEALRAHGMVRSAQRRWDEAESLFERVHSMAGGVIPYDDGRTLCEWGSMALQAGKTDEARMHLREAQAIFHHLGARKHVERVTGMLTDIEDLESKR